MTSAASDARNSTTNLVVDAEEAEIGSRIREARAIRRITQRELAAELGLSFQQIQKYERGVNRISATTLRRIADFLGQNIAYFYGIEVEKAEPARSLTEDELELLEAFNAIEVRGVRRRFLDLLSGLMVLSEHRAYRLSAPQGAEPNGEPPIWRRRSAQRLK